MALIERVTAQNIIHPILEIFFRAEIRFFEQGQIPATAHGAVLKERKFKSSWITPDKLIRDFHDTVALHLWEATDPGKGCVFWVRDNGNSKQGNKNCTEFTYAVDVLGADGESTPQVKRSTNVQIYALRKAISPKSIGCFTPEEVIIGIFEATGTHTIQLSDGDIAKSRNGEALDIQHTSFSWNGATELQTKASEYIFGLSNEHQLGSTVYIVSMVTQFKDSPDRNTTSLRFANARPEF